MSKGTEKPRCGRRRVLKKLGLGALAGAGLWESRRPLAAFPAATESAEAFPFELVPAAQSGISWVHRNGRSPEYYLPETTGAGCAFLDYDNDGWMVPLPLLWNSQLGVGS